MKAVIFLLLALSISAPAVAQNETGSDTESTPKVENTRKKGKKKKRPADKGKPTAEETDKPAEPRKRTSRMNRATKKIGLGAELGLMFSATAGGGLELSFNSGDSLQFGGGISYGKEDLTSQGADAEETSSSGSGGSSGSTTGGEPIVETEQLDLTFTYANAIGKFFVGNSFFFSAGLGYRIIETNIRVSSVAERGIYIATNTKSTSICLDIGLGNRWQFDSGFYIGGNWFAAAIPLASSYTATTESGGSDESIDDVAESNKDLAKDIGSATHYRLAVLQLGFHF